MQQRVERSEPGTSPIQPENSRSDQDVRSTRAHDGLDEAALDRQNRRLSWILGMLLLGFGLWKGYALLAPVYLN